MDTMSAIIALVALIQVRNKHCKQVASRDTTVRVCVFCLPEDLTNITLTFVTYSDRGGLVFHADQTEQIHGRRETPGVLAQRLGGGIIPEISCSKCFSSPSPVVNHFKMHSAKPISLIVTRS